MNNLDLSQKARKQLILRALLAPIMMIALVFLVAGRWDFWRGWVYWGTNTIILILMGTVFTKNSELVEERLNPKEGMKGWDKFYFAVTTPLYVIALILGGLDARQDPMHRQLDDFSSSCFLILASDLKVMPLYLM